MARNTFDQDETLEQGFNMYHVRRLYDYMKPYMKSIVWCMFLMVISSILGLLGPYIIKVALDDLIPAKDITGLCVATLAFILSLLGICWIMKNRLTTMGRVGQDILIDMRHDLFVNLQKLPFTYYDSRPHGKILVRVVNYINSLSDLLSNGFVNLVADIFSIILTMAFMFVLDTRLALVSLIGVPILMAFMYPLKALQRKAHQKLSTKQSNMNAYVSESINGMRVTQAFAHEEESMRVNEHVCAEYSNAWLGAVKLNFLVWPIMDNVATLTVALVYFSAVFIFVDDISVGLLVAFVAYVWRFWGPITNLGNFYNTIINATANLERIFELMDEKPTVHDAEGATELPRIEGHVEFEDVKFAYEDDEMILKGISFEAKPGERVAIVGPTGSGKTTIINLISRFYNINDGRILIDGHDISKVTLSSLRGQMGIMMQDSFIFSGTIMENIRYGRLDATDEEVIEAAKVVKAHDFIMTFENGYETVVNERGDRLSVGQRQLISFARALLANPKILILDEATSSIDSQTEVLLQQGLDELLKGRTSFVIAHRLSTIKNSDKIIYIQDGQILEMGTHDELVASGGGYCHLYTTQYELLRA
ncbi:MAG: ABC transporter ATP-binding protein/permease [Candidatus Niameybacter stercoravium]|nr:ABC transporter ATP-binding protein/permease [Candidatus Niameybacter stercoravium]